MTGKPNVLLILQTASESLALSVPIELVAEILQIEERAQFADDRAESQSRIAERVRAALEREEINERGLM